MIGTSTERWSRGRRLLTAVSLVLLLLGMAPATGRAQDASPEPIVTETPAAFPSETPTDLPTGTPTETLTPTSTPTKGGGPAQIAADGDMPCPTNWTQLISNGSFESPVIADGWYGVNSGAASWTSQSGAQFEWLRNFGSLAAAVGSQYTEVNTNAADTMYQSVTTTPGQTLHISFYHSSRTGDSGNQLNVFAGPNLGSLTQLGATVTTNAGWVLYERDYTVPDSQTTTIIAFTAVSPSGGNGNEIDGVSACEGTGSFPTMTPTSTPTPDVRGDMVCPGGYTQRILNGSFERGATVASGGYENVASGAAHWSTVSTNALEFLNNWGGLAAADGSQYTEVNTTTNDTVYQSITTTPGETLNITFYHSSRIDGSDNQLEVLAGPDLANLTKLGDTVETDGAWGFYGRQYLVPAGQTTTIFAFAAIEPEGSNGGNLVDGVSACEGIPWTATPTATPTPLPAYAQCQVGYTQILTNGSFETPDQGRDSWAFYYIEDTQGWTADHGPIEYLTNSEFMQGIDPPHGDQWMELVAQDPATISRELTTTPGLALIITFYHSARGDSGEPNVASVELGPDLDNLTSVGQASSDFGWELEEFYYVVPSGQTTTVLAFVPVIPEDSDRGNEIDAVSVCEGPPLPTSTPTSTPAGPPVELHFRACPAGATDAFRDCHDFGIADLPASFGGESCTTDARGNCTFDPAPSGDVGISWDSDAPASLIYCSVPSARGTNLWNPFAETIDVSGDEPITCDIYLSQAPTPPAPNPGVQLHFRACAPGATDVFRDCHDNPIPDMDAQLGSEGICTTDNAGNCAYDEPAPGDYGIWWDGDPALLVYCSDASDRSVNLWDADDETFAYTAGADITCDVFIEDPDLQLPTPQPTPTRVTVTDLPDTGAGIFTGGSALGVGIAMILAFVSVLGALGLAARRAGISPRA